MGLPNAGKSTLLNALIKEKVSIVSPRPQTTRDNILGIWTDDDSQIVFVDTPGVLRSKNALEDYMKKSIDSATHDVDCILVVIDGHKPFTQSEFDLLDKYIETKLPVVVAVTKIDITQTDKLMIELQKLNAIEGIEEVYCVTARRNKNVNELRTALKKYLCGTEMFFEEDDVTDKSQRYMVCELIREKILLLCDKEVPHGIGVQLNKMEYSAEQQLWDIDANIIIEKASHKPIILGKNGSMIKQIGTNARLSIQYMLNSRVHLSLWVKLKEDWRNSGYMLSELGYTTKVK